ncbi:hypothetical protein [Streptomyces sp. NPDC056227]|uniref:hypothetical protein n=1 Tax=Streptomyces sp. NPDC056227 TaxID=3345753 RepID=UPI0035D70971
MRIHGRFDEGSREGWHILITLYQSWRTRQILADLPVFRPPSDVRQSRIVLRHQSHGLEVGVDEGHWHGAGRDRSAGSGLVRGGLQQRVWAG